MLKGKTRLLSVTTTGSRFFICSNDSPTKGNSMKKYEGRRTIRGVNVSVNGVPLNPRLDLRNHSPTGFEWGYGGSGAAQLALAILADYLADHNQALDLYQRFKWQIIAHLPWKRWVLGNNEI